MYPCCMWGHVSLTCWQQTHNDHINITSIKEKKPTKMSAVAMQNAPYTSTTCAPACKR